jgi:hypothetical protein
MHTSDIKNLIEKYYNGETSLREEQLLRDFFTGENVPDSLQQYIQVFAWIKDEQQIVLANPDFERNLEKRLSGTPALMRKNKETISLKSRLVPLSIAATILLLIGLVFFFQFDEKQVSEANNQQQTLEAYRTTEEALTIFSSKFNLGLNELDKLSRFDDATHNFETFNKFFKSQNTVLNTEKLYGFSQKQD